MVQNVVAILPIGTAVKSENLKMDSRHSAALGQSMMQSLIKETLEREKGNTATLRNAKGERFEGIIEKAAKLRIKSRMRG